MEDNINGTLSSYSEFPTITFVNYFTNKIESLNSVEFVYGTLFSILFLYSNVKTLLPKSFQKTLQELRILFEDYALLFFTATWMLAIGPFFGFSCLVKYILNIYIKINYGLSSSVINPIESIGILGSVKNENNSNLVITSVKILRGRPDLRKIQNLCLETIGRKIVPIPFFKKISYKAYPKFFQYLDIEWGYPVWKPAIFNIENHVKLYDGSNRSYNNEAIMELLSDLSESKFKPKTSPWEILILPKYKDTNEKVHLEESNEEEEENFCMIFRIHHGIGDGYSLLKLLTQNQNNSKNEAQTSSNHPKKKRKMPLWKGFLLFFYFMLRSGRIFYVENLFKDINPLLPEKYPANHLTNRKKQFLVSQPMRTQYLKNVKNELRVGLTPIFLTALNRSTNSYILNNFKKANELMSVILPVPAANHPDFKMINKFSIVRFELPTQNLSDKSSLIDELKEIDKRGRKISSSPDGLMNQLLFNMIGMLPMVFIDFFLTNKNQTLAMSNLPGPTNEISIWGHELIDTMFWLPCLGHSGISVSIFSYKENIKIGLTLDKNLVKDGKKLLDEIVESIYEIGKLVPSAQHEE